jgi:hypothetical protein
MMRMAGVEPPQEKEPDNPSKCFAIICYIFEILFYPPIILIYILLVLVLSSVLIIVVGALLSILIAFSRSI